MTDWFYSVAAGEQHGPVPAKTLAELYQTGQIGLATQVWREGMAGWRSLAAMQDELGLHAQTPSQGPVPPPLPAAQLPRPPITAARPGLPGYAIAAIVGGMLLFFGIIVLGILAAIALPAYQQYVVRSQTAAAIAELTALKAPIEEFIAEHDRCPDNEDTGFKPDKAYANERLQGIVVGEFDTGHCGLEARLHAPSRPELDGQQIWLEFDAGARQWTCSANIPDKYLPAHCRG